MRDAERNTWVELDREALGDNIARVRSALSDGCEIIFVVKADGYGHGMVQVAKHAASCGVKWFAVAHGDEAAELRGHLPDAEIIVMGVARSGDVPGLIAGNMLAVAVDDLHAAELSAAATEAGGKLRCHAKVDSGMGRLGVGWSDAADGIEAMAGMDGIALEGCCSHFAASDDPGNNYTTVQAERFRSVIDECRGRGIEFPFVHVANSGGILSTASYDYDGVRPGILLYGYRACETTRDLDVRPCLSWKTRVLQVKDLVAGSPVGYGCTYTTDKKTRVAILDVGYADGYPRLLSNRGEVLLGGRRASVLGRVSMNFTAVEAGSDTRPGDEAVLLGSQGGESLWADELAGWADTIRYEILTNIRTNDRRASGR